ncbi:MAG TPA: DciA family protein [Micropruina sp.]|jgi:predicted nucleic acid-binding Zn ribbon protein|nr:DciA family protein [Micropruina sp.]
MPEHDPTGIELARLIARSAQGATPDRRPAKPPRRPKPAKDRPVGDPQPLGEALDELIASSGWATDVNLHHLLGRWSDLVGATNAEHSTPEGFEGKVLQVRTDTTAWATNLRLLAPSIVARLNDQLGDGTVLRIVVKGPDAPSWKHGMRSVRDGRGPRDTYG